MFIDFSIKDLIDILLVAYLLYQTYRLIRVQSTFLRGFWFSSAFG
jgi:hypothetical protein